ncbi:CDP-Glycerol:Poly(glycerophosphate) glycerophosphotransferase [Limimonas halophila]|uniref:CDP-Glycerol:Poly(Glycerophosphate) glycerophosphotransferase n=1 Tax=Limimonas halophila TaxID=1082479 RepID=A0A1G7QQ27_9PROT|nr:CDP-glycerol glycerophosphotransferase family protein [Limimonas halophila]SDG00625.1 CDP-Glycerol:Poly(glycerophosphate) glycerophosphotransferase [Limimonas halophila]
MRIGFLLNHEAGHQVLHAAPVACELSRRYPAFEVLILVGSPDAATMVQRVLSLYPDHRCRVVRLRQPRLVAWATTAVSPIVHAGKVARLSANRGILRQLDVLVTPEKTSLKLREDPALRHLLLIHTRHGAGDRPVGFDARAANFDLVLAAGAKIRDRLVASGSVAPERCAVVGYPKFDVAPALATPRRPFPNDKPVVLYNPHYSNAESSWVPMGKAVIDHFVNRDDVNLIFAPHVILYKRPLRHRARPLLGARRASNIHVDTGSAASQDMSHLLAADIYLGDVSSQVYEFLYAPRPCIFLDGHNLTEREPSENLRAWSAGEVVDSVRDLPAALARARTDPDGYRDQQRRLFAETFHQSGDGATAGARAADAIAAFLRAGDYAASDTADWPAAATG